MSARSVIAVMSVLMLTSCALFGQTDLQVSAPRSTLRVGETVQLSVKQRQPDGTTRDMTGASAVSSIGSYNYRTVFVFVRNEDSVGWIELKVVHA